MAKNRLKKCKRYFSCALWTIGTALLIAAVHWAATFSKESPVYVYDSAGRFFAPLLASFFCMIIIQPDDLKQAFVITAMTIFLSLSFIAVAYFMPCLVGVGEALDLYFAFVLRDIFIAAIFIFPTTFVGGMIGCAVLLR